MAGQVLCRGESGQHGSAVAAPLLASVGEFCFSLELLHKQQTGCSVLSTLLTLFLGYVVFHGKWFYVSLQQHLFVLFCRHFLGDCSIRGQGRLLAVTTFFPVLSDFIQCSRGLTSPPLSSPLSLSLAGAEHPPMGWTRHPQSLTLPKSLCPGNSDLRLGSAPPAGCRSGFQISSRWIHSSPPKTGSLC